MSAQVFKILFVEDLESDRLLAELELKRNGIKFISEQVETEITFRNSLNNFQPDIIISDYSMPEFDGMSALKITREFDKYIPFIILTGSMNEDTAVDCMKSGANDYVIKEHINRLPFAVLESIRRAADKSKKDAAQKELKKSRTQYRNLFNSIRDAILVAEIDRNIIACNPAFEDLFGYKIDEIKGKETSFIYNDLDEFADMGKAIKSKIDNPNFLFTVHYKKKDGEVFAGETNVFYLKNEAGDTEGLIGTIRDISPRLKIEKEFKESERKFRSIFDNHSAVKLIIDPGTDSIVEANKAAAEFYGWSESELKQMKITDINTLSPDELKKEMKLAQTLKKSHFEFVHKKSDGSLVNVEVFSSNVKIDGKDFLHSIIHDVTEKKKTEEQLKLLSRSVEQSPVSIVITNSEGNIEYVNSQFCEITGYSFDEVYGKNPRILKSGEQSEELYSKLWETITSGKNWEGDLRNKKKNGELFWEHVVISPIENSKGDVTHFVAVKEDVTDKKIMIEELVLAKEKAEASDQIKSDFLAQISHEIRTPMNAIIGFNSILREESKIESKEIFDGIQGASKRIIRTIDLILNTSEVQRGNYAPLMSIINLESDIFREMKHEFLTSASIKGLNLSFISKVENPTIKGDRYSIGQIFVNLIENAIKYTDEGSVEIIIDRLNDNYLSVSVNDTGIGISKEFIPKLFENFTQEETGYSRRYEGNGLGLALVKKYCELNNCEIKVESQKGIGSKFTVIFAHVN